MMTFLATYEIGKAKSLIKDEDIMTKLKERCEKTNRDYLANPSVLFTQQLKMDLSVTDVPDRVSKHFRQFEKIIADNGFHEFLGRGAITDDDYVARMKRRTKILTTYLKRQKSVADDEIARELERMCEEVKVVLSDDQYTEFREKVTKLSKAFHRLWGLGLVQMNQHWFNLWW
ncbi:hypothetical protein F443_18717 [Phytophthora nicotianae P1569]|uniref:Uncharacterized protein n=1 Tax=Phytophthora nicotianae P1569 TaxID=1317065 RepID=V9E723_PHYNI|nr:hypothetical protein F443_18717 [Phytophthora nicotianae P1569]